MYNMTQQRLPAPYELNTPNTAVYNPPTYAFAKGGRARKSKHMTKVHMNPHELNILDHLQGGPEYGHEGIKMYSHLEELLKNPHIIKNVHRHVHYNRQRRAHGGLTPSMERLREGGRYGDNELAMIGPHTHHLFNQLAGYRTRNPNTGHPEYFGLKDAFNGIWDVIKPVAGPLMDVVKPIAAPLINELIPGAGSFAGPVMDMIGNAMGGSGKSGANTAPPPASSSPSSPSTVDRLKQIGRSALPTVMPLIQKGLGDRYGDIGRNFGDMMSRQAESMVGPYSDQDDPYYSSIGKGIGRMAQGYTNGENASQSFGRGLQTFGRGVGGRMGNAFANTGESLGEGRGWRESAQRGYNDYFPQQRTLPMAANQQYDPYENQGYEEYPYENYV